MNMYKDHQALYKLHSMSVEVLLSLKKKRDKNQIGYCYFFEFHVALNFVGSPGF